MSCCEGKIKCKIYRDKKYCTKSVDEYKECNCRHARFKCQVEQCVYENQCSLFLKGGEK